MNLEHPPLAATLQIRVGNLSEGAAWYQQLLGRPADFTPSSQFHEWELFADFWIQVSEGQTAENAGRFRLGVSDVVSVRMAVIEDLGTSVSEVVTLPRIVAYCDFDDPWGNPLGLFQDLALHPEWAPADDAE